MSDRVCVQQLARILLDLRLHLLNSLLSVAASQKLKQLCAKRQLSFVKEVIRKGAEWQLQQWRRVDGLPPLRTTRHYALLRQVYHYT